MNKKTNKKQKYTRQLNTQTKQKIIIIITQINKTTINYTW